MTKNHVRILRAAAVLLSACVLMSACKKAPDASKNPQTAKKETTSVSTKQETKSDDTVKAGGTKDDKKFKDIKVKAFYLTGSSAGSSKVLDHIIALSKTTELNAVVIDVKDDFGKVNYITDFADAKNIGAYSKFYDAESVVKKLHESNIYVIGRIVTFKDPLLGEKRPDLAIKRPNGQVYRENNVAWMNAYQEDVWKYNIGIAKDAVSKGFDEIQFDYVRFPAARKSDVNFGQNPGPKADAIGNFLKMAYKEIHEGLGVPVSADVFGIVCESPGDSENIGQDIEKVGMDIDSICPMVYPSHYANKAQNGQGQTINGVKFTAPDLEPYKVVYNSLAKAKDRISKVSNYKAKIRPYLQDFTASWLTKGYYKKYTAEDVKEQIKAAHDAGYDEWILWDAQNKYSEDALSKK